MPSPIGTGRRFRTAATGALAVLVTGLLLAGCTGTTVLPQADGLVYIGLTDEAFDGAPPDVPQPSPGEIEFLITTVSSSLAHPLTTDDVPIERLTGWYRRFVDTRSSDAAERTLQTALAEPAALAAVEAMMFAAVTDHVFVDGGHTIDFTNKAWESLEHLGRDAAPTVLPTLVMQTTQAQRSEEFGE